jgi:hypothetical protein
VVVAIFELTELLAIEGRTTVKATKMVVVAETAAL